MQITHLTIHAAHIVDGWRVTIDSVPGSIVADNLGKALEAVPQLVEAWESALQELQHREENDRAAV